MGLMLRQPLYAVFMSIIYIGIVYLAVRREQKLIAYAITFVAIIAQITFLYFWFQHSIDLMTSQNTDFDRYMEFAAFIENSYFILGIPFLLLLAGTGIRTIIRQDMYLYLKGALIVLYIPALTGILILGQLPFVLLYYGFAP